MTTEIDANSSASKVESDKPYPSVRERKPVEERFPLPEDPYEFVNGIIDHYPTQYDKYTLRKLMSIGRITYAQGSEMTACVINTKPYTLSFGVPFMEDNMETMADCVYMLSHELTHLALDHFAHDIQDLFKDKKLGKKAAHIIVDCQVNATCHHSLKEAKYFAFIQRFYPQEEMPLCFMRADGIPPKEYREAHEKLYSIRGITNEDLIDALMPWFQENQDKLDDLKKQLLGNHDDLFSDRSSGSGDLSDIAEHVVENMEDWINDGKDKEKSKSGEGESSQDPEGKGKGEAGEDTEEIKQGRKGGDSMTPNECKVNTCKSRIEYAKRLKQQLDSAFEYSPQAKIHRAIADMAPKRRRRGVIPNYRDRRASAIHTAGHTPLFYKSPKIGQKVIVPCYLDVSGSQGHVLPVTMPVVARLKQVVGEEVFCFSCIISPCHVGKLREGNFTSTGGTCFNVVAEHILKNNFKSALILTDGEARLSEENIAELKRRKVRIKVGWTVSRPDLYPLKHVCTEMFYVFGEGED